MLSETEMPELLWDMIKEGIEGLKDVDMLNKIDSV